MADFSLFLRFLLAMVLGALIGLERERFAKDSDNFMFGGIRTFMFIALLGAVAAFLATIFTEWFVIPIFFGLTALLIVSYHASVKYSKGGSIGLTGEVVALLTFFFGVIAFSSEMIYAVVLAIITTAFLYGKKRLHSFAKTISKEEMYSTLVFAIIAFVILPFLPNEVFGPYAIFNPYKVWLLVVFIAGLGFIGYILIKVLGSKKGLGLTGLLGGLVSSTAVTMAFAGNSKKEKRKNIVKMFVFATIIANAVMFVRVLLIVYVVNKEVLPTLLLPMVVMCVVALVSAAVLWLKREKADKISESESKVTHSSPLSLGPAIKFGILFVVVLFVAKLAQIYFGDTGLFLASIASGFVDVDAITLSMTSLAGTTITTKVAAMAITLAVMSNTVIKFVYAAIFGSKQFRNKLGIVFALIVVAGLLTILLF